MRAVLWAAGGKGARECPAACELLGDTRRALDVVPIVLRACRGATMSEYVGAGVSSTWWNAPVKAGPGRCDICATYKQQVATIPGFKSMLCKLCLQRVIEVLP